MWLSPETTLWLSLCCVWEDNLLYVLLQRNLKNGVSNGSSSSSLIDYAISKSQGQCPSG